MKKIIALAFFSILLSVAWAVLAQETCPEGFACPEIILAGEAFSADFYLNEQILVVGQNRAVLQIPHGAQTITLRNIQNPGEIGFNTLFVYEDANVSVNLRDGQTRQFRVTPRKSFIRGTLNHTCEVRNQDSAENVSCQIIIDGIPLGETQPASPADFILDPGSRLIQVQLVGEHAALWEPTLKEQTANISAGRTVRLRTSFDKRAHLMVKLNQPNAVGDIYVNGELVAAQVATYDAYVAPNANYTVDVRNVFDPEGGSIYYLLDSSTSAYLRAGQERILETRHQKVFYPTPVPPIPGSAPACWVDFDFSVCPQYRPTPRNCDEVVARGIPERVAACCFPARDRDQDGLACYGT